MCFVTMSILELSFSFKNKLIINAGLNEITSALEELETLCENQSLHIKDLQSRIFPKTV